MGKWSSNESSRSSSSMTGEPTPQTSRSVRFDSQHFSKTCTERSGPQSLSDLLPLSDAPCQQLFSDTARSGKVPAPRLVAPSDAETVFYECKDVTHTRADCEPENIKYVSRRGRLVLTDLRLVFMPSHRTWNETLSSVWSKLDIDGDGKVSAEELAATLGPIVHVDAPLILEQLQRVNGSTGGVSWKHFERAIQRRDSGIADRHLHELVAGTVQLELGGIAQVSVEKAQQLMVQGAHVHDLIVTVLDGVIEEDVPAMPHAESAGCVSETMNPDSTESPSPRRKALERRKTSLLDSGPVVRYAISVQLEDDRWIVWRRFSEFVQLHTRLSKLCSELPKLPPKIGWFGSSTQPDERRRRLRKYMRDLLLVEGVFTAAPLLEFLALPVNASRSLEHRKETHDALHGIANALASQSAPNPVRRISSSSLQRQLDDSSECESEEEHTVPEDSRSPRHGSSANLFNEAACLRISMLNGEQLTFCIRKTGALKWCKELIEHVQELQGRQRELGAQLLVPIAGRTLPSSASFVDKTPVSSEKREASKESTSSQQTESFVTYVSKFSMQAEYARLGVGNGVVNGELWRLSDVNDNYSLADTYPSVIACPAAASDELLVYASKIRSKQRLPVLTWLHPVTRAPLCRCSQPLSGLLSKKKSADHELLNLIRQAVPHQEIDEPILRIVDARSWVAATANKFHGGGMEQVQDLDFAQISFLGIDNIHEMRASLDKIGATCASNGDDFVKQLADSQWLDHQTQILRGACFVANCLQKGHAVLVHCSDGWDRTSQLVSLAQLLLDPFYRTIEGFAVLVEKDWCAFGHRFQKRSLTGHDGAPVFLQWLECVWQIAQQFPSAFEFSDDFLALTSDAMYSQWFSNFAGNCQRDRNQQSPFCFWPYAEAQLPRSVLYRPLYVKNHTRVDPLVPVTATYALRLWPIHTRNKPGTRALRARLREHESSLLALRGENEDLHRQVQELKAQLNGRSSSASIASSPGGLSRKESKDSHNGSDV